MASNPYRLRPGVPRWVEASSLSLPSMLSSTLLSMPEPCNPWSRDTLPPSTPPARDTHPLQHTPTPTTATTMLAPTDMQESSLSHNKLALCLRSLLQPSSALSQCEFATCKRALIPSPVPACLRSRFRDPPWSCLQVNLNHHTCDR